MERDKEAERLRKAIIVQNYSITRCRKSPNAEDWSVGYHILDKLKQREPYEKLNGRKLLDKLNKRLEEITNYQSGS